MYNKLYIKNVMIQTGITPDITSTRKKTCCISVGIYIICRHLNQI